MSVRRDTSGDELARAVAEQQDRQRAADLAAGRIRTIDGAAHAGAITALGMAADLLELSRRQTPRAPKELLTAWAETAKQCRAARAALEQRA